MAFLLGILIDVYLVAAKKLCVCVRFLQSIIARWQINEQEMRIPLLLSPSLFAYRSMLWLFKALVM